MALFAHPALAQQPLSANLTIDSFSFAKKTLLHRVYHDHPSTFYCGSEFDSRRQLRHAGYQPLIEGARAYRLEWEHVVPAHAFGQSFSAWREGDSECIDSRGKSFKGRRCAEKVEPLFRFMQADMHNLVPAIGELNGLRSNYSFAMIPGEVRRFGACDVEIEERKIEHPAEVRGDIARTYFYMEKAYPGHVVLSGKNRKLFAAWDRQDPVDAWECERERRITRLQGNSNSFVNAACQELGL